MDFNEREDYSHFSTMYLRDVEKQARVGLFTPNGDVRCAYCECCINGEGSLPTALRMATDSYTRLQEPAVSISELAASWTDKNTSGITRCTNCGYAIWVRDDVAFQQNMIAAFRDANPDFGLLGEWAAVRQTGGMCANATFVLGLPHERAKKHNNRPRFITLAVDGAAYVFAGKGDHNDETEVEAMHEVIREGSFECVLAALNLFWAEEKGLRKKDGRFS